MQDWNNDGLNRRTGKWRTR